MDNLEKLRNMAEIQASKGNYDHSPHLYGMHVGLQLALNIMETGGEAEPTYKERPKVWGQDKEPIIMRAPEEG